MLIDKMIFSKMVFNAELTHIFLNVTGKNIGSVKHFY